MSFPTSEILKNGVYLCALNYHLDKAKQQDRETERQRQRQTDRQTDREGRGENGERVRENRVCAQSCLLYELLRKGIWPDHTKVAHKLYCSLSMN